MGQEIGEVNILQIEHKQTLSVTNGHRISESVEVVVKIHYEMASSGWVRENLPARTRGTDFMTLVFLALHARPLQGPDLDLLVSLKLATPEDEGRLYVRITDVGLSIEMGLKRQTVAESVTRLAECGLVEIHNLPEEFGDREGVRRFRDSKGQYAGSKLYLLSGELERMLTPDVLAREVGHDVPSADAAGEDQVPSADIVEDHDVLSADVVEGHHVPSADVVGGSTTSPKRTHHVPSADTNMLACVESRKVIPVAR